MTAVMEADYAMRLVEVEWASRIPWVLCHYPHDGAPVTWTRWHERMTAEMELEELNRRDKVVWIEHDPTGVRFRLNRTHEPRDR